MAKLDLNVLEAALEAAEPKKSLVSRLGQQEAYRQYGEKAIQAYLDDADLVEVPDGHVIMPIEPTLSVTKERDEARLELAVTKKLYHQALDDLEAAVIVYKAERKVTDKRGRQLAALREALSRLEAVEKAAALALDETEFHKLPDGKYQVLLKGAFTPGHNKLRLALVKYRRG